MKPKPFHFSGASVRANLAGRKTVTRRPMKPQPPPGYKVDQAIRNGKLGWFTIPIRTGVAFFQSPPRFKPGDVFYMAERIVWLSLGPERWQSVVKYLADGTQRDADVPARIKAPKPGPWKGRTIPIEWARDWRGIITDVRPERLGDMTHEDAVAEGIFAYAATLPVDSWLRLLAESGEAVTAYTLWWNSIYKQKWNPNTWVWRYEYKEHQG